MRLYEGFCEDGVCDLAGTSKVWEDIQKQELTAPFWDLIGRTFGYRQEHATLLDSLIRLLVTDLAIASIESISTLPRNFCSYRSLKLSIIPFLHGSAMGINQGSILFCRQSRMSGSIPLGCVGLPKKDMALST